MAAAKRSWLAANVSDLVPAWPDRILEGTEVSGWDLQMYCWGWTWEEASATATDLSQADYQMGAQRVNWRLAPGVDSVGYEAGLLVDRYVVSDSGKLAAYVGERRRAIVAGVDSR